MSCAQLLLAVFDVGYELSSENLQLSHIESLYDNEQYSLGNYCPLEYNEMFIKLIKS